MQPKLLYLSKMLSETDHDYDVLRSLANQTLPSTLIDVGIFLGTCTCGGRLIEW